PLLPLLLPRPPYSPLFPYTTLFRSFKALLEDSIPLPSEIARGIPRELDEICKRALTRELADRYPTARAMYDDLDKFLSSQKRTQDRKSTRLNSSHVAISYAVFCFKK